MSEPISSSTQSTNYASYDPEEGGQCVAPNMTVAPEAADPEAAASNSSPFVTTYGDGKIHREGIGLRVDPAATSNASFKRDGYDLDVTVSGIEALVAATTNNADGSEGARLAVSANLFQAAATASNKDGDELTLGVAVGVGADVSSGSRDIDADGQEEYCLRVSAGFLVGGFCTETIPAFINDVKEGLTR